MYPGNAPLQRRIGLYPMKAASADGGAAWEQGLDCDNGPHRDGPAPSGAGTW